MAKRKSPFDHDTVWLSIDQMAELFQRDKRVIGKHVSNIFKEGELTKETVWAKFAYTASDGKERLLINKLLRKHMENMRNIGKSSKILFRL